MPHETVPIEQLALAETAGATIFRALSQSRSFENLCRSMLRVREHVDEVVDEKTASSSAKPQCRPGCAHCCHYLVYVSVAELAHVVDTIRRTFTGDQLASLKSRIEIYERAVFPDFGRNVAALRPKCPLLVDGLCTAYNARPLRCRGTNSLDVRQCEKRRLNPAEHIELPAIPGLLELAQAASRGVSGGLNRAGVFPDAMDLGRALGIALADPECFQKHLEGEPVFQPAYIQSTQTLAPENISRESLSVSVQDSPGARVRALFSSLRVPSFYDSEDEIDEWREHFNQGLDQLESVPFDASEAYRALPLLRTFELAYHQREDRAALSRLGKLLCETVAKEVAPHLSEPIVSARKPGRIRVGYIGCNLSNSNGGYWSLGWMKNHSEDFETFAIFLGDVGDEVTMKFAQAAGSFLHCPGEPLGHAKQIRALDLDVLIYPELGLAGRNYQYACLRLARAQCTAWGHPVTSGLPTIDYYLSSELMEPEDGQDHYCEQLVRLPGSGLCYSQKPTPLARMTRSDFGLDNGPLYLSAQNPMKYAPKWDSLYAQVCERTGRPIMFLEGVGLDTARLKARFRKAGINAIWLPTLKPTEFLTLTSLSDVCLDSPGWNGGNTTIQALALRKPVVSMVGDTMRGRHGVAFLTQARAEGLLANRVDEYVTLATDIDRLRVVSSATTPEAMFEDLSPVRALDEFIRVVVRA